MQTNEQNIQTHALLSDGPLKQLKQALEKNFSNHKLNLSAALNNLGELSNVVEQILGSNSIVLSQAQVSSDALKIGVTGQVDLLGINPTQVTIKFTASTGGVQANFDLDFSKGGGLNLTKLAQQVTPNGLKLPSDAPQIKIADLKLDGDTKAKSLTIEANSQGDWNIIPGLLTVNNVDMSLERDFGAGAKTVGTLGGTMEIGSAIVKLNSEIPGETKIVADLPSVTVKEVVQELFGDTIMSSIFAPDAILNIRLPKTHMVAIPTAPSLTLNANAGKIGELELIAAKEQGQWGFGLALAPDLNQWNLGQVSPILNDLPLDRFNNLTLVLSTLSKHNYQFENHESIEAKAGLTLSAGMDLKGLGIDKLITLNELIVQANIARGASALDLSAILNAKLNPTNFLSLGLNNIHLRLTEGDIQIGVTTEVDLKLGAGDPIILQGSLDVGVNEADLTGTMQGTWNNPFGIKGFAIDNPTLEIGISYEGLPTIALSAGYKIGSVTGHVAGSIDSGAPEKSLVSLAFNHINLGDTVQSLTSGMVKIPQEISHVLNQISLQGTTPSDDFEITLVPVTTTIGNTTYQQGFRMAGEIDAFGFKADIDGAISNDRGVHLAGSTSEINIGHLVNITGANGKGNPSFLVDTNPSNPEVKVSGQISMLGMTVNTDVNINDKGFNIQLNENLFGLYKANVKATANISSLDHANFEIDANLQNDFTDFVTKEAGRLLANEANAASVKLSQAEKKVTTAQQAVDTLNKQINNMRAQVRAERAGAQSKLEAAQRAVNAADNSVNSLNNQINALKAQIGRDQAAARAKLQAAQNAVNAAQNKVNGINNQIASKKARINHLKKQWYNPKADAEIVALSGEIAALGTALGVATGALQAAKTALSVVQKATHIIPVDSDPRVIALYTALGTAKATLKTAQAALAVAQKAVVTTPIDADPRVAALITAKTAADAALTAAKATLETTQTALGVLGDVASWIATHGADGIINVHSASFSGGLGEVSGGHVDLKLDLVFLGHERKIDLDFNLKQATNGVQSLVHMLTA